MSFGRPDNSWYQFYIDQFLKTKRGLSVNCLWFVYIDCPVKAGLGFIADSAKNMSDGDDYSTKNIYKEALKYFTVGLSDNAAGIGARPFFLAHTVEVPEDSIDTTTLNSTVQGGSAAISPKSINGVRRATGNFSTYLYLNDFSFPNTILRPWVRAMSLYGMKFQCLRTQMRCVQYTRQFTDGQWQPTLQLAYFGVFPTTAPAYSLNYNGADITKSVNVMWGYDYYRISLGDIDYDSTQDTGWDFTNEDAMLKDDKTWHYTPIHRSKSARGADAVGEDEIADNADAYADAFKFKVVDKNDITHSTIGGAFSGPDTMLEVYGDDFNYRDATPNVNQIKAEDTTEKYGDAFDYEKVDETAVVTTTIGHILSDIDTSWELYGDDFYFKNSPNFKWKPKKDDTPQLVVGKLDYEAKRTGKIDKALPIDKKDTSPQDVPYGYGNKFKYKSSKKKNVVHIRDKTLDNSDEFHANKFNYVAPLAEDDAAYPVDILSKIYSIIGIPTIKAPHIIGIVSQYDHPITIAPMIFSLTDQNDVAKGDFPYIYEKAQKDDTPKGTAPMLNMRAGANDTPNGNGALRTVQIPWDDVPNGKGTLLKGDVDEKDTPVGDVELNIGSVSPDDTPNGSVHHLNGDVDPNDTPDGSGEMIIGFVDENDTPKGTTRYLENLVNENDTPTGSVNYIENGTPEDDKADNITKYIERSVDEYDTSKGEVKFIEHPSPEGDVPNGSVNYIGRTVDGNDSPSESDRSVKYLEKTAEENDIPNGSVNYIIGSAGDDDTPARQTNHIERSVNEDDTPKAPFT